MKSMIDTNISQVFWLVYIIGNTKMMIQILKKCLRKRNRSIYNLYKVSYIVMQKYAYCLHPLNISIKNKNNQRFKMFFIYFPLRRP